MTERNIRHAFRSAGIFPVDVEKPLKKTVQNELPPQPKTQPKTSTLQKRTRDHFPYTPKSKRQLVSQLQIVQKSSYDGRSCVNDIGIKAGKSIDSLIVENTTLKAKISLLEAEVESTKSQGRKKVQYEAKGRFPTREEIKQAKPKPPKGSRKKQVKLPEPEPPINPDDCMNLLDRMRDFINQ
jgi:hypothetical protein